MVNLTLQSWREKPVTVTANKEQSVVFTDSQPNYINIYNFSNNQIFVSRAPGVNQTLHDFAIPPLSNRQWAWARGITSLYLFQAGPGDAQIRVTSYEALFDPAAVVQSGQNVVVAQALNIASMPDVHVSNLVIPVEGSVSVTSIPAVTIAAGSVNATILNANINTEVTNAMLNVNPFVVVGTGSVTGSIGAGGSLVVAVDLLNDPNHGTPLGIFDEAWIYISSPGGHLTELNIRAWQLNLMRYNIIAGYVDLPLSFMSAGTIFKRISNSFSMPGIPFDQILFSLNNPGGAITTDTYTVTMYAKYGQQTIDNGQTNPVIVQPALRKLVNYNTADDPAAQTLTLIPAVAGQTIYEMWFTVDNTQAATSGVLYYNGMFLLSVLLPLANGTAPQLVGFGGGVENKGVSMYLPAHSRINGYAIVSA